MLGLQEREREPLNILLYCIVQMESTAHADGAAGT